MTVERKTYGVKVNHLPQDITKRQVHVHFNCFGSIASITLKHGDGECYGFVNFYSHSCAEAAANYMNGALIGGKRINCKAQCEPIREHRSPSIGEYTVKVTCISKDTSEDTLSRLFSLGASSHNIIQSIRLNQCPKEPFNFAYVNYFSQSDAERAVNRLDQQKVDGSQIRVKLHPAQQVSQHSPKSPDVRIPLIPNYTRSLSTMPPHSVELGSPPVTVQRQFSHPQAVPIHTQQVSQHSPTSPDVRIPLIPNYTRSLSTMPPHSVKLGSPPVTVQRQFSHPQAVPIHTQQVSQHSPTSPDVRIPLIPNYTRSLSTMPPHSVKLGSPPVTVQRQFSHPQAVPIQAQHNRTSTPAAVVVRSHTVKVSIFGELSSEDVEEVFSRFGKIRAKPVIRGGEPFYTFVNFTSPMAATNACNLHNSTVKGIKIYVKIQKQSLNLESKEVRCTSLIASILQTRHGEELERLKKDHQVQVSSKPSANCVKVWGGKEQVAAVEVCLRNLMEKVEGDISVKECKLPSHSVPLFKQDSAIEELKKVEATHGVEFSVLKSTCTSDESALDEMAMLSKYIKEYSMTTECGSANKTPTSSDQATLKTTSDSKSVPVKMARFCKDVKECFTATESGSTDKTPTCSELASYLKEKPQSPSTSKPDTTWLWQNDSGTEFSTYTSEVCAILSKAFVDTPSGSTTVINGSFKYLIDFSSMTQTNITSGRSRPIQQAASTRLNVQWFYKNDKRGFVPYTAEQSAEIEQMYKSDGSRSLVINRKRYMFDFATMTQCNVVSRKLRKIERHVEIGEEDPGVPVAVERVLTLQASGVPPSPDLALKELEAMVKKATIEKECRLYDGSSVGFKAKLVKNMNKYFVTTNLVDECLKLKGMPQYVERVYLLAEREKISDFERRMHDGVEGTEFQLPPHWKPQTEEVCLHAVKRGSNEWNNEVGRIHETLTNATIIKLERIQNKWLWERYSFAKKRMSKKNKDQVNEKHLFHGTRDTPPEKVYRSEKGVDFRFSREGLFGTGSYFAVNASYSNSYAYTPPEGISYEKQMFICKVLTGESYNAETSDKSLRQPPLKPNPTHGSFKEECYDSVKGYTKGSTIYTVYDHEKVYPAYLVTYCSL